MKILFLADSHLGLDLPLRTRVTRRRRGDDFLRNYRTALQPALDEEVDVVIHGGDVFDRPRVPSSLAYQAFDPLIRIGNRGIPVFIVPGNHERSRLLHGHLAKHPNVRVFDRARTFTIDVRGVRVTLTGFPFERGDVRTRMPELLRGSGWERECADVRLLCMHQCAEGATVGPQNFTFTTARDVIRHADVPSDFAAVLSGHIHRQQVLTRDLRGRPIGTPVIYPGSIERTAFAERDETKGYMILRFQPAAGKAAVDWTFRDLPARPMVIERIGVATSPGQLAARIREVIANCPPDAVLAINVEGLPAPESRQLLSAANLRAIAPPTMNVEIRYTHEPRARSYERRRDAYLVVRPEQQELFSPN